MPTYDYQCNACKHRFELFQSMSEPLKRKCPSCGKNALQRLIGTGAAVLFKGSGFYQTDYRSDAYKKSAESDAKPAATPAAANGEAAKADTKGADPKPSETKAVSKPEPPKSKPKKKPTSSE
jgi:putative FmdB family regulatory protein